MRKKMYTFAAVCFSIALAINFISCDNEESNDFNKGREIFISNNVALNIIFPETNDTILYRDTTSGFTGWVKDGKLNFTKIDIRKDSISFKDKKHFISLNVTFHDATLSKEVDGIREFNCQGDAVLYLDTLRNSAKKTQLIVSPLSGNIKNDNLNLYSGFLHEEQQPYLTIRSKAKKIN